MSDVWATFGKGMFVCLAIAGGIWIGRGGQLPLANLSPVPESHESRTAERDSAAERDTWRDDSRSHASRVREDRDWDYDRDAYWNNRNRELSTRARPRSFRDDDSYLTERDRSVYEHPAAQFSAPQFEQRVATSDVGDTVTLAQATRATVQTLPALTFGTGATAPNAPVIESISTADRLFPTVTAREIWLPNETQIEVRLKEAPPQDYSVTLVQKEVLRSTGNEVVGSSRKIFSFNLNPDAFTTDPIVLQVKKDHESPVASAPFVLRLGTSGTPKLITDYRNNLYLPDQQLPDQSAPIANAPVPVFNGYLKLKGRTLNQGDLVTLSLEFLVDGKYQLYNDTLASTRSTGIDKVWEIPNVNLPTNASGLVTGRILAYVTDSSALGLRRYSAPLNFQLQPTTVPTAIVLDKVTLPASTVGASNFNQSKVQVHWKDLQPTSPTTEQGLAVLLLVNESEQPRGAVSPANAIGNIPWEFPSEGRFSLRLAVAQGNQILVRSEAKTVGFSTRGPRITGVELANPFSTPSSTVLRIALDPSNPLPSTQDPLNAGLFVLKRNRVKDPIVGTAIWLPVESIIELKYATALEADGYELTILPETGGTPPTATLADIYGNKLGAAYVHRFFKSVGDELPSESRGLSGITGPNIEYKEYTDRRSIPEGFNPSDKVVTRVARLYYYRDAHRVVQLLNRTARSYNRQAVDQQQQLADNAQRNAQDATSNRRIAEREAVRAAQKARAAESALNQAQAGLVQAQAERQSAINGLPSIDSDLAAQEKVVSQRRQERDAAVSKQTDLKNRSEPPATPIEQDAAQNVVDAANRQLAASETELARLQSQKNSLVRQQTEATARLENSRRLVDTALGEVQSARQEEVRLTDTLAKLEEQEERDFRTLFLREVAAATADPDTYAPGNPKSDDPIAQVSLSVIGEGEIQLRGPLKGVNLARTLINQIDAPVGQVRVAIHTVQVNGERGERMEPVVERIQRYVDHSRFLTSQSAQMLRHAVTHVAAQQAEQVLQMCEGLTQQERDEKYLHAFFGKEFIAELYEMDSEFLRTGNKLLSLHSMDSTSLAQALFLLALAKNDVRMAILQEFERLTTCQLPQDEQEYFTASSAAYKFGPPFQKQKYQFLGHNARFVSLKGYFNAEVAGPDTITPMQREFIRLAQIFKSRLVAEREIIQRVMERSLIEDRFADYTEALKNAQQREQASQSQVQDAVRTINVSQTELLRVFTLLNNETSQISKRSEEAQVNANTLVSFYESTINDLVRSYGDSDKNPTSAELEEFRLALQSLTNQFIEQQKVKLSAPPQAGDQGGIRALAAQQNSLMESFATDVNRATSKEALWSQMSREYVDKIDLSFNYSINLPPQIELKVSTDSNHTFDLIIKFTDDKTSNSRKISSRTKKTDLDVVKDILTHHNQILRRLDIYLDNFSLFPEHQRVREDAKMLVNSVTSMINDRDEVTLDPLAALWTIAHASRKYEQIFDHVSGEVRNLKDDCERIVTEIGNDRESLREVAENWLKIRERLQSQTSGNLNKRAFEMIAEVDTALRNQVASVFRLRSAQQQSENDRRPLDHKKFLDMLVDDSEDKYIEILEGTRAHTANVDNYLARIITALDDDFNTQFYHPTFKHVREAGRYWDVQMGQIETTTVLTNNRTFAKVSPQAMMEFDLPKRDILITEAFESAAAAYQDYGALLHDPTFLSLTKMYRGQPPSAVFNGGMPNPLVRDVLPGLPSATNEQLMIQQGATAPDFPSALESLIPDPAIYKFETGTGFEIRPVIQPDGQAVVFQLKYMYTTNLREPVRADEKHLGRIKRHFVDTDVNLGNFELREVSKYTVALKASRTARGVPLLEDVPVAGILFRPLPQQQSSLQQNLILSQATIFPTLFDLMGLRWAPAIADLGVTELKELDFVTRNRRQELQHRVFDVSSGKVDEFLQIPEPNRRPDLYRPQNVIPRQHPNGDVPHGLNMQDLIPSEGNMLILPGDAATMPSNLGQPLKVMEELLPPPTGELRVIEPQSYQVPQSSQKEVSRSVAPPPPSRPVPRGNGAEPGKATLPSPPPQKLPSSPEARGPAQKTSAVPSVSDRPLAQRERSAGSTPAQPVVRSQDGGDVTITNPKAQENSRWRWKLPAWSR